MGDANVNSIGAFFKMQLRFEWSAHKHELIRDEVSTVIQMHSNQSACDRITDFALAKSGPLCLR